MTNKEKLIRSIRNCDMALLVTMREGSANVEIFCENSEDSKDIAEELGGLLAVHLKHEIENEDFPNILSVFVDKVVDDPQFGVCGDCQQKIEDEQKLMEMN